MIPEKIRQVSLAKTHIMVLTEGGDVFIWGKNHFGLLGLPRNLDYVSEPYLYPWRLTSLPKISYISSANEVSAAVTTDGRLYVWGRNKIINIVSNFQEGDQRFSQAEGLRTAIAPVEMEIGSKVNYIALGNLFTIASTVDGIVNYM